MIRAMRIGVLFLGPARDWVMEERARVEVPAGGRLRDVVERLAERYPQLARAGGRGGVLGIRWAVNREFSTEDRVLNDGDEVAVIPPVSGG